jgi:hypothetical protein
MAFPKWSLVGLLAIGCGSSGGGASAADQRSDGGDDASADLSPDQAPDASIDVAADLEAPADLAPEAPASPAQLSIDRPVVDFGGAVTNDLCRPGPSISFRVTNTGDQASSELTTEVGEPFAITADGCSGVRLAGHGFCDLVVQARPSRMGEYQAVLQIRGASGEQTMAAVSVEAFSGDALAVVPNSVDFGDVVIGQSETKTVTLQNIGGEPASLMPVTASTEEFELTGDGCSGLMLAAGGACTVEVAFRPKAIGSKTALLMFTASGCVPGAALAQLSGRGL